MTIPEAAYQRVRNAYLKRIQEPGYVADESYKWPLLEAFQHFDPTASDLRAMLDRDS